MQAPPKPRPRVISAFIPKRIFRPFVWAHPIVDRLRDLVAAAKAKTQGMR